MSFEFATAGRILFGAGKLKELGSLVGQAGSRALLVTGKNRQRAEPLHALLKEQSVDAVPFAVTGEPEVETVRNGTALAKAEGCDFVVGMGGGSAIDAGKAIAAMLTNAGDVLDYLEIIGRGKVLKQAAAPYIAVPTTAGTGAEVTRNAVLSSPEHRVKVSLRSPLLLPKWAIVDAELTYDLPASLTASTGFDALTQLIEPFVCSRANPVTDALCVQGIRCAARSLRRAVEQGGDTCAREEMALASLLGGLALANAGLGAVHGFAGPIGGRFSAPHGAICAALLPHVMDANLRALRAGNSGEGALGRYREVARLLTGDPHADAASGVEWVRQLSTALQIPRLGAYGISASHVSELAEQAGKSSSIKANPVTLSPNALAEILTNAI